MFQKASKRIAMAIEQLTNDKKFKTTKRVVGKFV